MRIVTTGGTGFIGTSFVHTFLEDHADVDAIVLGRFTYTGNRDSLNSITGEQAKCLKIVEGDIVDAELVGSIVADSSAAVHFAAESHNDDFLDDPSPFIMTNLIGAFTLFEAVRHRKVRFHYISTDEVYDDLELDDLTKFIPSTPYSPSSPYSPSKAGSDLLVRTWVCSLGVEAVISNCPNNYGLCQYIEKFIPRMTTNRPRNVRLCLCRNGLDVRDWTHVRGHDMAVWEILIRGQIGETYLIGADGEANNHDVVMILNELMGCTPDDFDHVADRPGHDLRYAIDSTRLCEEFDWSPHFTDFRSDLANTIEQCMRNEAWWAPLKGAAEARYAAEEY